MVTTSEFFATLKKPTASELFEACCGLDEQVFKADRMGMPFNILRNPNKSQLNTLLQNEEAVKGLIAQDGALFVWKPFYMTHDEMIQYLLQEQGIDDIFTAYLYLKHNEIITSKSKILSAEEKNVLFDNLNLKKIYGENLDISFPDLEDK